MATKKQKKPKQKQNTTPVIPESDDKPQVYSRYIRPPLL